MGGELLGRRKEMCAGVGPRPRAEWSSGLCEGGGVGLGGGHAVWGWVGGWVYRACEHEAYTMRGGVCTVSVLLVEAALCAPSCCGRSICSAPLPAGLPTPFRSRSYVYKVVSCASRTLSHQSPSNRSTLRTPRPRPLFGEAPSAHPLARSRSP